MRSPLKKWFWMITFLAVGAIVFQIGFSLQHQGVMDHKIKNRLASEKSPYLLQHQHNPVDWYPWGEEAFQKAKQEHKPVFLSIGYSTCHWCHVMAHESFEDKAVAQLMNETFINIKVDREERPDIDHLYMLVCQAVTGHGGWPLTVVLTPDKKPFFVGTYFPKQSRSGRIGMLELIPHIKGIWEQKNDQALESAQQIIEHIKKISEEKPGTGLGQHIYTQAYQGLARQFDSVYGGFGNEPKFPTPHQLFFLLRYAHRTGNKDALAMVEKTLLAMRRGGIYDQIGFGFHRYSTDRQWLVPHFEKMLYDQALLAIAYIEVYQITKNPLFRETAEEIFVYVLRDLKATEGGFYSAEDADSEGEEGKFYLWTMEEVKTILTPPEAELYFKIYQFEMEGNHQAEASGERPGTNIPHLKNSFFELAKEHNLTEEGLKNQLEIIRKKLFKVREMRIHPSKDDKILTDWNGLMIAALAKGAQAFQNQEYLKAAKEASHFILKRLLRPDGSLLHRFRSDHAAISGNLDDYAFLVWGLIEIFESDFKPEFLQAALEINRYMLNHFWDQDQGGLYFTSDLNDILFFRKKEIYDGAIPSGNAIAMLNLFRLAHLTGQEKLAERAVQIELAFSKTVTAQPLAYTQFLVGSEFSAASPLEVVVVANPSEKNSVKIVEALQTNFYPYLVSILKPSDQSHEVEQLIPFIANYQQLNGLATIYVCKDFACRLPMTKIEDLKKTIDDLKQNFKKED